MDSTDLREHLAQLHAELANSSRVDPEDRQLLGELMGDIKRLLEPSTVAAPTVGSSSSIAAKLEGLAVQFEADHPALAASTRRFVDLLGKVGL